MVVGLPKLDKIDGQPKVIDHITNLDMHISDSIQISFWDQVDFDDLSPLTFGSDLSQFLWYFQVEIIMLELILEVDSFGTVGFIVDVEDKT